MTSEQYQPPPENDPDDSGPSLTLRTGQSCDLGVGKLGRDCLRELLNEEPEAFKTLVAMIENQPGPFPADHIRTLSNRLLVNEHGQISETLRRVGKAAVISTHDGFVVVDPFTARQEIDRDVWQQDEDARAAHKAAFIEQLRKTWRRQKNNDGDHRGRS